MLDCNEATLQIIVDALIEAELLICQLCVVFAHLPGSPKSLLLAVLLIKWRRGGRDTGLVLSCQLGFWHLLNLGA